MFGYLERIMREDTVFKALTIEDTDSLAGLFGAVRFCYNKALYLKTHFYKVKGVNLHPIHDLKKLIAVAKKAKKYAWLSEYDAIALPKGTKFNYNFRADSPGRIGYLFGSRE